MQNLASCSDAELVRIVLNKKVNQDFQIRRDLEAHSSKKQLIAIMEIAARYVSTSLEKGDVFTSPDDIRRYLHSLLDYEKSEVFMVMYLDNQHRLIKSEKLFYGTINATSVYAREIVKTALDNQSPAVVLVHNHPSGVPEPSEADKKMTKKIISALALIDIEVLDHFVVGNTDIVSFAER